MTTMRIKRFTWGSRNRFLDFSKATVVRALQILLLRCSHFLMFSLDSLTLPACTVQFVCIVCVCVLLRTCNSSLVLVCGINLIMNRRARRMGASSCTWRHDIFFTPQFIIFAIPHGPRVRHLPPPPVFDYIEEHDYTSMNWP